MSAADGWTIPMACEQFAEAGMPVPEARFRKIIAQLPGFRPVGHVPSGPNGGRGHPLYSIADLQQLHQRLAEWLTVPGDGHEE